MIDKSRFFELLARRARVEEVHEDDVLFGSGLDITSIAFTEFIMEVEEEFGMDIDPDELDQSIKTVGALHAHLDRARSAQG